MTGISKPARGSLANPPRKGGWHPTHRDVLHALFVAVNVLAFVLVQLEVPDPYLDEIFHIPQTQRYCDEDFESWDPAITTPPGLYLLAAIPLMTVHAPCSPPVLRLTNLCFTTVVIPALLSSTLAALSRRLHGITLGAQQNSFWSHWAGPSAEALAISSLPLITFFGNLFYTDVASLAGVLAAWAAALRNRHYLAMILGVWSMTVRQTNVIWLGFIMASSMLNAIRQEQLRRVRRDEDRDRDRLKEPVGLDPLLGDMTSVGEIVDALKEHLRVGFGIQSRLLAVLAAYLPAFIGFGIFLRWNGGIVLGHKENHQPVVHAVQLLYCLALSTALCLPALLRDGPTRAVAGAFRTGLGTPKRAVTSLLVLGGMLLLVRYTTIIHPFLLADNRHYVFYLVRRIIRPYPIARYLLCGPYLYAAWLWLYSLRQSATLLWLLGFVICTAAVLVPTPLVEPRYYLIPMVILRVQLGKSHTRGHLRPSSSREHIEPTQDPPAEQRSATMALTTWFELAFNTAINVVTTGVFLLVRFRWEGWDGWMRFMW